ncbi:putative ribonuclease H domain, reverse transcriptase zinc-binding domain-containing protein [Arabidopsis thaliana]
MLKARYFRHGNFFSASRGTRPSYGWSSLRFGCELLNLGTQKNIGDGYTTQVGNEPWLPTTSPRPPLLLATTDPKTTVSALLCPTTSQWDEQKLTALIDPIDHPIIRKIYVPPIPAQDSYVWSFTKDCCYTVKSGYWVAATKSTSEPPITPPLSSHPDIADRLWKLNIVPKLKHFLWRTASRALGVADNLRRRNIIINPYRAHCCTEAETGNHIFFSCPHAEAVWRTTCLDTTILCNSQTPLEDKLRYLFRIHDDGNVHELHRYLPFWIMWRLWKSRNDLIFNKKLIPARETLELATTDTQEWIENVIKQVNTIPAPHTQRTRRDKWLPPPRGWVKCNYDASHHEGAGASGLGWIIRDSNGFVLDCGMGQFEGRNTIEEAECTSLIWAIQAAWGLGYRNVIFEGDNKTINQVINTYGAHLRLKHYMGTIQHWRSGFINSKFCFTHSEQNACADLLAKKTILGSNLWSLYHSCPVFLMSFVNNDYDTRQ